MVTTVECIKEVVLDVTNEVALTVGTQYVITSESPGGYLDVYYDNSGKIHGISHTGDEWFQEHFRVVE